jgi:hypothetical protein
MHKELDVIMELMHDLQEKMEYGEDDLDERLGRRKPGVEMVKIEGKLPTKDIEVEDLGDEMDMAEEPFSTEMALGEDDELEESPEAKLTKRIMKMRG